MMIVYSILSFAEMIQLFFESIHLFIGNVFKVILRTKSYMIFDQLGPKLYIDKTFSCAFDSIINVFLLFYTIF